MSRDVAADPRLRALAAAHPYPLVFATISGAHLYGFPSPDSDFDLRGVHVLPWHELAGLDVGPQTIERQGLEAGLDLDLVTHEVAKFCRLLLQPNGYVLEQLCSPLVVSSSPAHRELVSLVPQLVTRAHARHYLGFAATQWRLFAKEEPPRVKPLLYVYRVLLTGIHLMRTGVVEANVVTLNADARLAHVDDLVARKTAGDEHGVLADADLAFHAAEMARLRTELESAAAAATLPDEPTARPALHDLLLRVRARP